MRALALVLGLIILSGCKNLDSQLVGSWTWEEAPDEVITFYDNGTFEHHGASGEFLSGQWEVKGGLLCRTTDQDPDIEMCHPYEVLGSCLEYGGDLFCNPGKPQ